MLFQTNLYDPKLESGRTLKKKHTVALEFNVHF